jgi:hypothetical protein
MQAETPHWLKQCTQDNYFSLGTYKRLAFLFRKNSALRERIQQELDGLQVRVNEFIRPIRLRAVLLEVCIPSFRGGSDATDMVNSSLWAGWPYKLTSKYSMNCVSESFSFIYG